MLCETLPMVQFPIILLRLTITGLEKHQTLRFRFINIRAILQMQQPNQKQFKGIETFESPSLQPSFYDMEQFVRFTNGDPDMDALLSSYMMDYESINWLLIVKMTSNPSFSLSDRSHHNLTLYFEGNHYCINYRINWVKDLTRCMELYRYRGLVWNCIDTEVCS